MRWYSRTLLLLVLLGLVLAGCRAAPEGRPGPGRRALTPTPATAAPTTISWSFWGEPWEVEIVRRVARAFEAEHPTVRLQLLHQPWGEYFGWLEERWREGNPPDVMFLNNVRGYASRGLLATLDGFLERDSFELVDFYPRLLELYQYRGRYFGLPRDNDTKVIYYNRQLFAEAGLEPPQSDWTWTDLRNLASRLTRRDPFGRTIQYGFAPELSIWWRIWVWQNGGDILDDPFEPHRVTLAEPAAVDALQFLADIINIDRVTPPVEVLRSSSRITALFREGRLAMAFGGHGKVPILIEEPGLRWDVVGLPSRKRRANVAGGAGYAIAGSSPRKDAAWLLVRFLAGVRGQAMFAESGLVTPARRSIREDNIFLRQQPYSSGAFADETEFGRPNLNIPQAGEINQLLETALLPVWLGEVSPAEAIEELVPQLRRLVER